MIRREVVETVPANHIQIGDTLRHGSRDYVVRSIVIDKAIDRRYVFDMLPKAPPAVPGVARPPAAPATATTAPEGGKMHRVRVVWERPMPPKPVKKAVKKKVAKKAKSVDEAFLKSILEDK